MVKEFVPYEIALNLKELGFNERCLASYYTKDKEFNVLEFLPTDSWGTDFEPNFIVNGEEDYYCSAPLYQQAFRWFEDKHSIFVDRITQTTVNEILGFDYILKSWKFPPINIEFEKPYDEFDVTKANNNCLKKLIEIVKT